MHWKRTMVDLARGTRARQPPLFAPLVRAAASQIDAITPQEMIADPTRLSKGIMEFRRAAGLDILVTATPNFMEAEALGAIIDRDVWPAKWKAPAKEGYDLAEDYDALWTASQTLEVSIETTHRLALEVGDDVVIVAALTGPGTLLTQLHSNAGQPSDNECDFVGRGLAALVRRFGQAGANLIVFVETTPPSVGWSEFFPTIANTAKFLKMPVVATFDGPTLPISWPRNIIPGIGSSMSAPAGSPFALVLDRRPEQWSAADIMVGNFQIVTTAGEVAADAPMETLLDQILNAKELCADLVQEM